MKTATNFHTVSGEAKDLALTTINKYHIQDSKSGELGFWLGFDVLSDHMAIAMLIQEQIDLGKPFKNSLTVFVYMHNKVPSGVLKRGVQLSE